MFKHRYMQMFGLELIYKVIYFHPLEVVGRGSPSRQSDIHGTIPKVTLKVNNQDRMFFADFSVNCQPIFMKFCNNHISTES